VSVVQVNMGHVQDVGFARQHLPPTEKTICCRRPTAASRALLDDLTARGLLDETLVVMLGEFRPDAKS